MGALTSQWQQASRYQGHRLSASPTGSYQKQASNLKAIGRVRHRRINTGQTSRTTSMSRNQIAESVNIHRSRADTGPTT